MSVELADFNEIYGDSNSSSLRTTANTRNMFLDPEGGSQNATLVVVVVISSLRVQKSLRLS